MVEQVHPNHRHLPFGERREPRTDFGAWDIFPYETDPGSPPRLRMLEPPLPADPPRSGESGAEDCRACAEPDAHYLWTDEHWRLLALSERGAVPAVVMLEPRAHADLADLEPDRAAEFGPMIQRVERAVLGIGGIGRVHVSRWGDGGAHLHLWFFARPLGVAQLRGSFLPMWDDLLPPIGEEQWRANMVSIAAAMARGGGVAHEGGLTGESAS